MPKSTKDLVSSKPIKQSPLAKHVASAQSDSAEEDEIKVEDVEVEQEPQPELKPEPEPEPVEKSEAELRAEKIPDRQIDQYWRKLERQRTTKRVHQEDLTLAEKVLRYWDVSSQYGPCVGINRMKRWKRAEKLGLNPPLEVLAVLQKEEGKGTKGVDHAHMDQILNSTTVGAA